MPNERRQSNRRNLSNPYSNRSREVHRDSNPPSDSIQNDMQNDPISSTEPRRNRRAGSGNYGGANTSRSRTQQQESDRRPNTGRGNSQRSTSRISIDQQRGLLLTPGFSMAIREQFQAQIQSHLQNVHGQGATPLSVAIDVTEQSGNNADTPNHRTMFMNLGARLGIPERRVPRPQASIANHTNLFQTLSRLIQTHQQQNAEGSRVPLPFMVNLVSDSDDGDELVMYREEEMRREPLRRSRRLNNLPPEDIIQEEAQISNGNGTYSDDASGTRFMNHRFPNFGRPDGAVQQRVRRLVRDNPDGSRDIGGFVVTRTYNLNEMDRIPDEEGSRNIFPGFDQFFDPFESFTYEDWINFQEALGNAPRDHGVKSEVFDKLKTVMVGHKEIAACVDLPKDPPTQPKDSSEPLVTNTCACVICMTDYVNGENAILLNCRHHYHNSCIKTWFASHSTCPVCRYQVK